MLPLLRFTVVYGVAFVAPASCSFAAAFAALLLLCCCFVAAAAGAFRSPTVEKPIFARYLPKSFLLLPYSVVCAAVLLLFGTLCAAVCTNLLLLVRLVCVFPVAVAVAVAAFFVSACTVLSVVCPAFDAAFGSPTVEKPTLVAFDFPKCQEQFYNRLAHHCSQKVNNQ